MVNRLHGGGSSGRPPGFPPEPPPPCQSAGTINHSLRECYLCLRSEVLPMSSAVHCASRPSVLGDFLRRRGAPKSLHRGQNSRENGLNVVQHLMVPEAQYPEALGLQPVVADLIAYALQMLTTVDFKDQLSLEAHEIDDVGPRGAWRRNAQPRDCWRSLRHRSLSAAVIRVRRARALAVRSGGGMQGMTLSRPRRRARERGFGSPTPESWGKVWRNATPLLVSSLWLVGTPSPPSRRRDCGSCGKRGWWVQGGVFQGLWEMGRVGRAVFHRPATSTVRRSR